MAQEDTDLVYKLPHAAHVGDHRHERLANTLNRSSWPSCPSSRPTTASWAREHNPQTEIMDLEHIKKQIQKDTMESNKKVWQKFEAPRARPSPRSSQDGRFDPRWTCPPSGPRLLHEALQEPAQGGRGRAPVHRHHNEQVSSSISQNVRADQLRRDKGPQSVLGMNTKELNTALATVKARVEQDYKSHGGGVPKIKCLEMLKIPEHLKRMLRKEYTSAHYSDL